MSWNLKVAEMQSSYLTDKDIWQSTHHFYYHGKTTTTYKYGFLKALLESIPSVNEQFEITFDHLFYSFTKIYWNLVIHNELWQSNSQKAPSSVQKVLNEFATSHAIPKEWSFDQLPASQQLELIAAVKKVGKKYVIGATYGDFNGQIYSFDLKKESLQLHPTYYQFFQAHKRMLTDITNYQLALFLEKFNEAEKMSKLLTKIEVITQRKSLLQFSQLLQNAGIEHCFYCEKKISKASHIDHFIPWSYMQSDHLWNFVLSCPTCNIAKNNKLAAESYLQQLITRNNEWVKEQRYIPQFENYTEKKLMDFYQYSQLNGFVHDWEPSRLRG